MDDQLEQIDVQIEELKGSIVPIDKQKFSFYTKIKECIQDDLSDETVYYVICEGVKMLENVKDRNVKNLIRGKKKVILSEIVCLLAEESSCPLDYVNPTFCNNIIQTIFDSFIDVASAGCFCF